MSRHALTNAPIVRRHRRTVRDVSAPSGSYGAPPGRRPRGAAHPVAAVRRPPAILVSISVESRSKSARFGPAVKTHTPWSMAGFVNGSVPSCGVVQPGPYENIVVGLEWLKKRFGPRRIGRRAVASDGSGDFGDGGCRERIDGGER